MASLKLHGADLGLSVTAPTRTGAGDFTRYGQAPNVDGESISGGVSRAGVIDVYVVRTSLVDLQRPDDAVVRAMPHTDVIEVGFEGDSAANDFGSPGEKQKGFA